MSIALRAARGALGDRRAWLVGGAVRDRLLGREVDDLDLVVEDDVRRAALALARAVDGVPFALSEDFGAWRVIGPGRAWQADLSPLRGARIEADLARRDFTVNAIAEPLDGGAPIDPFSGRGDLAARRLRMVAPEAFDEDPLRALRLVRLECELDLEAEPATRAAAGARAIALSRVAPERVFAELRRIVVSDAAVRGLERMHELGITAVVLPELEELRGVEQSVYHHLDVHEHTLAVLQETMALERDPSGALGPERGEAVAAVMRQGLADELTRWQALRFVALLHDAAKPDTRGQAPGGRVTFVGHDHVGADLARRVLGRLRASERLRAFVAAVTREHLRLGFLVHEQPLQPRAVYRYLRACEPVEIEVTLFTVADRLATRGRRAGRAIAVHLELAGQMLDEGLRWREQGPPVAPLRGDELAAALGMSPGPRLGRLLEQLAEARFAGEVATREEAIDWARAHAAGEKGAG